MLDIISGGRLNLGAARGGTVQEMSLCGVDPEETVPQVGEALRIEPVLDSRDAGVVDVDVAAEVRRLGPVRIDAAVFGQETDAGDAEAVDALLLHRRDFALEPDEAFL